MGQSKSKELLSQTEEKKSETLSKRVKRPEQVLVDRPRLGERRAVLTIPNSPYRVLYVDPIQRADVVGKHGYVVLKTATRGWTAGGTKYEGEAPEGEEAFGECPPPQSERSTTAESELLPNNDDNPFAFIPKPEGTRPSPHADSLDLQSNDGVDPHGTAKARRAERKKRQRGGSNASSAVSAESSQKGGEGGGGGAGGFDVTTDSHKDGTQRLQQFIRPTGRLVQNFIYFEDRKYLDDDIGEQPAQVYEQEEEEIYDIAGVKRIAPKSYEPTAADLSYDVPSKVLDALRMAIDAPLSDFRAQEVGGDEDEQLALFRQAAMKQLEAERANDDPFAAGNNGGYADELVIVAAPIVDHSMTHEEIDRRSKVKRKKLLHKEVHAWKKSFEKQHGKKPSTEELNEDEEFGPTYREYQALRKELQDPADVEEEARIAAEAAETAAAAARSAAPVSLAPANAVAPLAAGSGLRSTDQWPMIRTLAIRLDKWKKNYELYNGAPPTKGQIMLDPEASDWLLQLRRLAGTDAVALTPQDYDEFDRAQGFATTATVDGGGTTAAVVSRVDRLKEEREQRVAAVQVEIDALQSNEEPLDRRNLQVEEAGSRRMLMSTITSVMAAANDEARKTKGSRPQRDQDQSASEIEMGSLRAVDLAQVMETDAAAAGTEPNDIPAMNQPPEDDEPQPTRGELLQWLEAWRDNSSQRLGRALTLGDLEDDPFALNQFEAFKQQCLSEGLPVDDFTLTKWTTSEVVQDLLAKRRKELGKQLNKWKASFQEDNGRKPTAADIAADPLISSVYDEYMRIPKQDATVPEPKSESPSTHQPESPPPRPDSTQFIGAGGNGLGDGVSESAMKKRKKQLHKELDAWKEQFMADNGREPTEQDLEADADIWAVHQEFTQLKEQRRRSTRRKSSVSAGGMSAKQLAKQLNAWKHEFEEEQGRKPTMTDIEANEEVFDLYQRYQAAKAAEVAGESPAADEAPAGSSEQLNADDGDALSDFKAIHKRRKQLGKELNAWKDRFLEEVGHKPKESDLLADEEIRPIYEEHERLKSLEKENPAAAAEHRARRRSTVTGSRPMTSMDNEEASDAREDHQTDETPSGMAQPVADASPQPQNPQQRQRKQLAGQLNAWKAQFTESNGRAPTVNDILQDPSISEIYQQYISIPKDAGAGGQALESNASGAQAAVSRKKMLAKQLNAWKALFTEQNGRAPKTQDILDDPEICPVYEEYLTLKKDD